MSDSNEQEAEKIVTASEETDGASAKKMASKKTDQEIHSEFVELINALKHRSRTVRQQLEQSQSLMTTGKPAPNDARMIDKNAAQFMRLYALPSGGVGGANAARTRDNQPSLKNDQKIQTQMPSAVTVAEANVGKSRRMLLREVEALQDLIKNLALQSPEIKANVLQLAEKNEILSQLDMFRFVGGNEAPTCSRYVSQKAMQQQQQRALSHNGKVRHESEVSTASSSVPINSKTNNAASDDSATVGGSVTRKNRKRKSKNKKANNETTTFKSELEALRKYINQIVQDFLGQTELPKDMIFDGDFSDLEAHAKRLVAAGLGRIVEDEIRINRKNNRQAFITMSNDREGLERDGIVVLPVGRRYAFEGDIVRAFVLNTSAVVNEDKPKTQQKTITGGKDSTSLADDEELSEETESQESDVDANDLEPTSAVASDNCPKAFVITVIKQTELRQIVGTISFTNPIKLCGNQFFYKLKPHDMRVPMAYVPVDSCAAHISKEDGTDVCGLLFLAHILETDPNGHCIAQLLQPVGRVGNLEAEIKAILLHNGLRDVVPYEERFNEMFANEDAPIDSAALKNRLDLRNKCVFTIDPMTARDLDDAVSIEQLNHDEYEVGVHISDVSHYLSENSELDNIVKERATSIYLVNEVIHMLPQTLCFKCSLLPGLDKFAFSVFWTMNADGEVIGKPRFNRTVINSCAQFAYEHAQKIIDNPEEQFTEHDFPNINNGYSPKDISQRVLTLNGMARAMRRRRYENGALSINNPKLRFNMDPVTGEPESFQVETLRQANNMIEEFMLLANQAVARFIYDHYPDTSVLRNHAPPLTKSMKALSEKLSSIGFELDYSSSKAIQDSMRKMCKEASDPVAMDACLSQLLMKPMARAKYFCSEGKSEGADLWHYALSIPIYTHFTSPIRRYPDILVHRLLAASLEYCPPPQRTTDELHQLMKVANDRKYNAKLAGDDSVNLFFKRYVVAKQSLQVTAVVIEIFQHMLNVVTLETGHVIAINYKMQKVLVDTSNVPNCISISERNSNMKPRKLELLSKVDIKLVVWDNKLCGFFVSPDPAQRQLNSKETSKRKSQPQSSNVPTNNTTSKNGTNSDSSNSSRTQTYPTALNVNTKNTNNNKVSTPHDINKQQKKQQKQAKSAGSAPRQKQAEPYLF